ERIADRNHELPLPHTRGIAERGERRHRVVHLEHGEIGLGIVAHGIGRVGAAVGERRSYLTRLVHYVAVREQKSVWREEKAGARAALLARGHAPPPLRSGSGTPRHLQVHHGGADALHCADHRLRIRIERRTFNLLEGLELWTGNHAADSWNRRRA